MTLPALKSFFASSLLKTCEFTKFPVKFPLPLIVKLPSPLLVTVAPPALFCRYLTRIKQLIPFCPHLFCLTIQLQSLKKRSRRISDSDTLSFGTVDIAPAFVCIKSATSALLVLICSLSAAISCAAACTALICFVPLL